MNICHINIMYVKFAFHRCKEWASTVCYILENMNDSLGYVMSVLSVT